MIGRTKGMVAQHFDHPAIGDFPACALHDHAFQFGLERDHFARDKGVVGLRADGVDFPPDFLRNEVELFAVGSLNKWIL